MYIFIVFTAFTFWCAAGSWSSREASWVGGAQPTPSWVCPGFDIKHKGPMAEEEAESLKLLEELEEYMQLLEEEVVEEVHILEVVVEELGPLLLLTEEEAQKGHQGEKEVVEVESSHQGQEEGVVGVQ